MRQEEEDPELTVVTQSGCYHDDGKVMANVDDSELVTTKSCCWHDVAGTGHMQRPRQYVTQESHKHLQLLEVESRC